MEEEKIDFGKLDLGCGKFRKKGFLGIDNFEAAAYQGMKEGDRKWILEWDLNRGIPFPDHCIEEIFISHFLEHVQFPVFFLWEILRVCKHGAHIGIFVPLHEMESVGHVTEFHEYWFEDCFAKEFPDKFSITGKSIMEDKQADLLLPEGKVEPRKFDELNIVFKVVK